MRKADGTMMTLHEQTMNKCRHFNGMTNNQCKADVNYESVRLVTPGERHRYPCWASDGCPGQCSHASYHTQEEADERVAKVKESTERYAKCRKAIVEATEGKRGVAGAIKCPCCEGTLRYSVAGCNGHIHASCTTSGCASWME